MADAPERPAWLRGLELALAVLFAPLGARYSLALFAPREGHSLETVLRVAALPVLWPLKLRMLSGAGFATSAELVFELLAAVTLGVLLAAQPSRPALVFTAILSTCWTHPAVALLSAD